MNVYVEQLEIEIERLRQNDAHYQQLLDEVLPLRAIHDEAQWLVGVHRVKNEERWQERLHRLEIAVRWYQAHRENEMRAMIGMPLIDTPLDVAEARAKAAEAENEQLRERLRQAETKLGNIVDIAKMTAAPDWTKGEY